MVAELVKIPLPGLRALALAHKRVVVCCNSVTEIRTDLRGVRPRGYPEGRSWDNVPGLNDPTGNRVIIATRNGRIPPPGDGHAASNLVLHEESFAHFYNHDPTDAATYPHLHAYWASDPLTRAMAGR